MSLHKELEYESKIREISGVQFSVLSPEEIKRRSVVHVTQTHLYEPNGDAVIGGLFDPRMGVIDHGKICPTDGLDNRFSPGYPGHIELARPVFYIQFLGKVMKILKMCCPVCSKLLVNVESPEMKEIISILKGKKLYSYMIDKCAKIKVCGDDGTDGCGAEQPKYGKEGLARIYADWPDSNALQPKREYIPAEKVLKIFKRISDEECEYMGLSKDWCRPEWLICQVLPVAPPAVRPSIRQFSGARSEDDITHKFIDIIKTNSQLKKKLDSEKTPENIIDDWTQVLQYHVATLVDNELPGINQSTHRSGRVLKTLRQRLKGKEGRIRGNLQGKRVDFSARSVITPDPNISIDQLGVPKKIAMNLTFPEIVTRYNKAKLLELVRNGPLQYPGAKSIKKQVDGRSTNLQFVDLNSIELEEGDVVHRHLIDDDIVLFNRQPSLHKMSMMGHKVKVMDYNTFRLNVSVTKPYNADFDGDEMNMHVPQSLQTATELREITAVPYQIISPREHKPVIALFQDSILGLNRITNDGIYFTRSEMMNILMYIPHFDGKLPEPAIKEKGIERWSGRQLVSYALPTGLNMSMKNNSYNDNGDDTLNHVKIVDGQLVAGRIDSKVMSKGSNGLIHIIFNDFGPKACQQFLDDLQNIVTRYLILSGFSVGISDLIADKEINEQIKNTIIKKKKDVNKLVQQVHQQIFENKGNDSLSVEFEKKVNNILNKANSEVGEIGLKGLSKDNRMTNMVASGSKGKTINIAQMVACLGQQNVDGKRIPNGYNERALPHFTKYNVSPESRGFVENSFINGLTPQEFYFHAMGGREGLIDTAVKTSETGYIQRKLIKAMEDLKVYHNLSVRNANGNIVQFLYGEDGMDYGKIESQRLSHFDSDIHRLRKDHLFADNTNFIEFMNETAIKLMKKDKDYIKKLTAFFEQIIKDVDIIRTFIFKGYRDSNISFPININRIIQNMKKKCEIGPSLRSDINPLYVITALDELIASLKASNSMKGTDLFAILLRSYLSPKMVVKQHRLTKFAFDHIIAQIKLQYYDSLVQPGEMVGPIAAQSIGEPATQMTLNTFHFAGVSEKSNVTRGVPRLKELLHISKNPKVPSLTIYLNEDNRFSKDKSLSILNDIGVTSLKDITKSMRIFYDPNDYETNVEEDRELLEIYKAFQDIDPSMRPEDEGSDWVIRFEFDKQIMMEKDITMADVYSKIHQKYHSSCVNCIYSDDNSSKLVFRIRLMKTKKKDAAKKEQETIQDLNNIKSLAKNIRESVYIKGIEGIRSVSMYKNQNNYVYKNDSYTMKEEWVLDTHGVNLLEVLRYPGVDPTRTISNDIYEVYNTFGIEAAKQVLLKEIREVIDSGGSYVNFRHLELLVDTMTYRGYLMSIDRFGINRGNIGPLAKCSFEEATDQLFNASIFGEVDKLNGVSSNIMMGQIPPCGTGMTDVLLDESKLYNIDGEEEETVTDISQIGELDYCDNFVQMDFAIENEENDIEVEKINMSDMNVIVKDSMKFERRPDSPVYNPNSPTYGYFESPLSDPPSNPVSSPDFGPNSEQQKTEKDI